VAKRYRLGRANRLINQLFRTLTRLGLGAPNRHILTVAGRKSGRLYATPVDVLEHDGNRFLVAGYGPAGWVRNARAADEVTLSRGRKTAHFRVVDARREEAIPVLRKYIAEMKVTRAYFDARPDSPDDAIAAELERHPVLRLVPPP
jgi:deazaflavin-dependent oxidoreductase (nitroreductase family)